MTEVAIDGTTALKDFQDIPPPTFSHEKGGQYMLSMLSQRELWQRRPAEAKRPDPILFLNLQSERQYVFDGNTLKTQAIEDIQNRGEGFNGVVLVTGPLEESDTNVVRKLTTGIASLKPGASVFLFEKPEGPLKGPGSFVDKDWRKGKLKKLGLVEVGILNSGRSVPGSILWEAHMPREGLTEPINLLEDGPYYINGMIGDMKEKYKNQGWNVVDFDNSELAKKLKSSIFPLRDIHTIRDGFGIKVKSNQCPTYTCEGIIPIDTGNIELSNSCGEEHFPPEKTALTHTLDESNKNVGATNNVINKTKIEQHAPYCGDFPEHGEMQYDTRRKMYICPSCAGKD